MSQRHINRRELLQRGALGGLGVAALGRLAGLLDAPSAFASTAAAFEASGGMSQLIAAAKKEGGLNLIALPPDWANYGEILHKFPAKYGVSISSAAPNDSSAQENTAVTSLKGQSRAPDCVDVSPTFAAKGKQQGLYVPYKVTTWSTIPSNMKDANGYWTGDYWGVQSFLTNTSVVKEAPKDWSDLTSPKLKGAVAINGDPRLAGDAFAAVMAASLAHGGSLDNIEPGINFYARLKKLGNWNPTNAYPANIAKGTTPIAIKWDYLNLATRDNLNGNPAVTVTIPKSGVYGGYYCQAVSKYAPHPNAARLWLEYLYSDEGQLLWLKGYTHPARYLDLAKRDKIPTALAKRLPPASAYKDVKFASLNQIAAASKVLQEQWGPKISGS